MRTTSRWVIGLSAAAAVTSACLFGTPGGANAGGVERGAVYVALGDSFASGEGLGPYEPGTDTSGSASGNNSCHRSLSGAYASPARERALVLPEISSRGLWACAGSTAGQMLSGAVPAAGDEKPLERLGSATTFVSLSVGGDDVGLGSLAKACVQQFAGGKATQARLPGSESLISPSLTCDKAMAIATSRLNTLPATLASLYRRILDSSAPESMLVVTGYPRVFPRSFGQAPLLAGGKATDPGAKRFCVTDVYQGVTYGLEVSRAQAFEANVVGDPGSTKAKGLNGAVKNAIASVVKQTRYEGRVRFANPYASASAKTISCAGPDAMDGHAVNPIILARPAAANSLRMATAAGNAGPLSALTFNPTISGQALLGNTVQGLMPQGRVLTFAREVAAGSGHTCARMAVGSVKCWGDNSRGELGNSTNTPSSLPVSVIGITNAIQITSGWGHSCALLNGGTVKCWGENGSAQLGDNTLTDHPTPITVPGLTGVVQISAGARHTCAVIGGGSIKCWGLGYYGQIGDGTNNTQFTPKLVIGLSGTPATQVSAGGTHTCARLVSGTVKCWGAGGLIGDGTPTTRYTPTAVTGLTGVAQIAASAGHTCALLTTGKARCWGRNAEGQLGNSNNNGSLVPVSVTGLTGATQIATGYQYSCATLSAGTGTVKCWGENNPDGRLGDGTTNNRNIPTTVPGVTYAGQVTDGAFHTCMVRSQTYGYGMVLCWGANTNGPLGNGNTNGSLTPVFVLPG